MKKLILSSMLGLSLIAFGATDAKASDFCFDFTSFCDCLSVTQILDPTDGPIRRFQPVTWENQDCAGTESNLQGGNNVTRNFIAGELNPAFGLGGYNFLFSWLTGSGVFDLDLNNGFGITKIQDDTGFCIDAGACADNCVTACGGLDQGVDRPSHGR